LAAAACLWLWSWPGPPRPPAAARLVNTPARGGAGGVLPLFGAVVDVYLFSSMFNTYTLGEHARHSPGLILLRYMVAECARRGLRSFDIGVGRAHTNRFFAASPSRWSTRFSRSRCAGASPPPASAPPWRPSARSGRPAPWGGGSRNGAAPARVSAWPLPRSRCKPARE